MVDSLPKTRSVRARLKTLLKFLTAAMAIGYLVALIAALLILHFTADAWWLAAAALYLPRFPALIPLPFLTGALLLLKQKKLLWTQLVSVLVVIFPFMGFVLPGPSSRGDGPVMRVLSLNVNSGFWGYEKIEKDVLSQNPDVIVVQEIAGINDPEGFAATMRKRYPYVEADGEFLIASRFPVLKKTGAELVAFEGTDQDGRYMVYELDSPLGRVSVFNVHPISPRSAFYALRGNAGLRRALLSGEFFNGPGPGKLMYKLNLLSRQLQAASERARSDKNAVIIAGDLNLPSLSPTLRKNLSEFQDGFQHAGWGFGHTFPNRRGLRMWMRLDHILASQELDFVSFETGCTDSSDHYCVVADLQRR